MLILLTVLAHSQSSPSEAAERARLDAIGARLNAAAQVQTEMLRSRVQANVKYDNCVTSSSLRIAISEPDETAATVVKAAEPLCEEQRTKLWLATDNQAKQFGDNNTDQLMSKWIASERDTAASCIVQYRTYRTADVASCQPE